MKHKEDDWLSLIKEKFKSYPQFYYFIVDIFSPVYPNKRYNSFLKSLPGDAIVLNIGSGPRRLSPFLINVDINPYPNVDVISDICALPFADESIDGIINIVVLEHIPDANYAINEMRRILKRNGFLFCIVPFIQGYHASPHDYYRWTKSGIKELFRDFETIEIGVNSGPTSSFLWIFQEWLATLLSFNIPYLYRFLLILLMILTSPLKWLDLILNKYKSGVNIAASFYFFGKKV